MLYLITGGLVAIVIMAAFLYGKSCGKEKAKNDTLENTNALCVEKNHLKNDLDNSDYHYRD